MKHTAKQVRKSRRYRRKQRALKLLLSLLILIFATGAVYLFRGTFSGKEPFSSTLTEAIQSQAGVFAASSEHAASSVSPLLLVNKWNPLPEDFTVNLVKVPGGEKVDERIYDPLMELLEAAREANWNQLPKVVSGYRTPEKQQRLYEDKIDEYKQQGYSGSDATALARQWVALPGTSEHELGLAVDINGDTYDLYFWLQENSWKYGFIFRYPGAKTDLTGVSEEVWHYRYVGKEAAAQIYESGLCLEEYVANL